MHELLFWIQTPPGGIDQQPWDEYLDGLAIASLETIGAATFLIAVVYAFWASRIRIKEGNDWFKTYWPMFSLLGVLPTAGWSAYSVIASFQSTFPADQGGQFVVAVTVSWYTGLITFVLSVFLIWFFTPLTPSVLAGRQRRALQWLFPWKWFKRSV